MSSVLPIGLSNQLYSRSNEEIFNKKIETRISEQEETQVSRVIKATYTLTAEEQHILKANVASGTFSEKTLKSDSCKDVIRVMNRKGDLVSTLDDRGIITLWDIKVGKQLWTCEGNPISTALHYARHQLDISDNGDVVWFDSNDKKIYVFTDGIKKVILPANYAQRIIVLCQNRIFVICAKSTRGGRGHLSNLELIEWDLNGKEIRQIIIAKEFMCGDPFKPSGTLLEVKNNDRYLLSLFHDVVNQKERQVFLFDLLTNKERIIDLPIDPREKISSVALEGSTFIYAVESVLPEKAVYFDSSSESETEDSEEKKFSPDLSKIPVEDKSEIFKLSKAKIFSIDISQEVIKQELLFESHFESDLVSFKNLHFHDHKLYFCPHQANEESFLYCFDLLTKELKTLKDFGYYNRPDVDLSWTDGFLLCVTFNEQSGYDSSKIGSFNVSLMDPEFDTSIGKEVRYDHLAFAKVSFQNGLLLIPKLNSGSFTIRDYRKGLIPAND